jgi:phage/plasmid-associated DNA primase
LRKEIRDNQAEHDGVKLSSNVHWLVPKIINSLFTGRSDLVNRIQNALCPHGSTHSTRQKRFVITGMGGQGKSEVAIQVASMMREEYAAWLRSSVQTSS